MIMVSIFCVFSVCGKAKADIVFLVDESSSIGANNFNKIKDFIFRVTTYFPTIGPQDTQVSVTVKKMSFLFHFDAVLMSWLEGNIFLAVSLF